MKRYYPDNSDPNRRRRSYNSRDGYGGGYDPDDGYGGGYGSRDGYADEYGSRDGYGNGYDPDDRYGGRYDPGGYDDGYDPDDGYDDGYDPDDGYDEGYDAGYADGYRDRRSREPAGDRVPEEYEEYEEEPPARREKPSGKSPRKTRTKRRRWGRRIIRWLLLAAVVALLLGQPPGWSWLDLERPIGRSSILLAGTDEEGYRTDTIMLLSLDGRGRTARLLSIPRDTYVNAPYSLPKINSACGAAGGGAAGMEELVSQVEGLLGFRPDGYVMVDIDACVEIVDIMGGVDFNVPMDMDYEDFVQGLYIHLKAGEQHLNGEQAIQLVRFRSGYATADIGRTQVQREFIQACAAQWLRPASLTKIPELVEVFQEKVTTDLSLRNLLWLGRVLLLCRPQEMVMEVLPGYPSTINGISYYMPDTAALGEMVRNGYDPSR